MKVSFMLHGITVKRAWIAQVQSIIPSHNLQLQLKAGVCKLLSHQEGRKMKIVLCPASPSNQ